MKVLVAVDSFKGSLSSLNIANIIESSIHEIDPSVTVLKSTIADGGEGTIETLIEGLGGKEIKVEVSNPLFNIITATYGILNDNTAIIEMAQAAGLTLLDISERNPLYTTTFGVGEIILDAINRGVRNFIVGIGGSATNDAGIGMLNALGYEFYDADDNVLKPIGESLDKIVRIDDSNAVKELKECYFLIACDVDNPLYGPKGAAHVYGKQKGASLLEIKQLDKGLKHFSDVLKNQYNIDISNIPGVGAAGGIGGAFLPFTKSELKPGVDIIFEKIKLEDKIKEVDLIFTGEGRMDFQTMNNKAPMGVAKIAKKYDIPCVAVAGSITNDAYATHEHGITAMFSILNEIVSLDEAMQIDNAANNLKNTVKEIFGLIKYYKG